MISRCGSKVKTVQKPREYANRDYMFIPPGLPLRELCKIMSESPKSVLIFEMDDRYFMVDPLCVVKALGHHDYEDYPRLNAGSAAVELFTVDISVPILQAAELMVDRGVERLLVTRDAKVWGTITAPSLSSEILRLELVRKIKEEIDERAHDSIAKELGFTHKIQGGLSEAASEERSIPVQS